MDDDESVRDAMQTLLESTGRRTVAFAAAEHFLASDAVRAADCLIIDLCMPDIRGPGLQRRMLAARYRIPTIVLTAHGDAAARARALRAGAVAFLPKPFQPDILLEAVEAALRRAADVSDDSRVRDGVPDRIRTRSQPYVPSCHRDDRDEPHRANRSDPDRPG